MAATQTGKSTKRTVRTEKPAMIPLTSVRAWLRGSEEGRRMLLEESRPVIDEEVAKRCQACKHARRLPVLILMDSTGAIEVYSRYRIAIHVGHTIDDEDTEVTEAYLKSTLPKWAYEIFWPCYLQTRDVPQKRTIESEKERLLNLAILDGLKEWKNENTPKDNPKPVGKGT